MSILSSAEMMREGGIAPAAHAFSITPNDSNDLAVETRGIYIGGAGDLEVIMAGGETVIFVGITACTMLPIRVTRVKAGNTTATSLLGVY